VLLAKAAEILAAPAVVSGIADLQTGEQVLIRQLAVSTLRAVRRHLRDGCP